MSKKTGTKRRGLPKRLQMRHSSHFVDELDARSEPAIGKMVALDAIEADPDQPRSTFGNLDDLAASIEAKGVLEPVLIRKVDLNPRGSGSTYRLISGERRFRAAQQAGLVEIPAIEMEVGPEEALEIALVENLQRKDLTPFEEADGYAALGQRHGYTHQQISKAVGRSRSSITEALALLKIPAQVRQAIEALGIESKTALREISKEATPEEMIALAEHVREQGLSRDDLRLRSQLQRSAKEPAVKRTKKVGTKPHTFKFKSPEGSYSLSLSFRQATVDETDLIGALEAVLERLRTQQQVDDKSRSL